MVGWSIGVKATSAVAPSRAFTRQVAEARRSQERTVDRYVRGRYRFPEDIPANLVDRIHAHLLDRCERRYGKNFWVDFFEEVRGARDMIELASRLPGGDERRNALYRISVDCFDRLRKIKFKAMLKKHRISLTTDVKSLHPMDDDWDRRLHPPGERFR